MLWKPQRESVGWLRAGFSERAGGVSTSYGPGELNLGWTEADSPANVAENRRRWTWAVWQGSQEVPAVDTMPAEHALPGLVTVGQVHSADTVAVDRGAARQPEASAGTKLRGDGLITGEAGILLGIQTADCVPVLVTDVRLRVVAAFHAGWRGTAGRIVERGVEQICGEFGSRPEDLWAAVGPAVASCCYRVGPEVQERFTQEFPYAENLLRFGQTAPRWERERVKDADTPGPGEVEEVGGWFLDLREANRLQLQAAGVAQSQIELIGSCTACSRTPGGAMRYFSYRAESGRTGRMMALIGVREQNG